MEDRVLQELGNDIELLRKEFEKRSPEDRAYAVIKFYFNFLDNVDENGNAHSEVYGRFLDWLMSPENEEAKNRAMQRVFDDLLDEPNLQSVDRVFAVNS